LIDKEERLAHLRNLRDARFLSLSEYVTAVNKIRSESYYQQVLGNSNPCCEIDMAINDAAISHLDDVWSYTTISTKYPYYDAKSNSYKLLLKPLN
jgi:hypothetical protein